jgi:hypothetical protein
MYFKLYVGLHFYPCPESYKGYTAGMEKEIQKWL